MLLMTCVYLPETDADTVRESTTPSLPQFDMPDIAQLPSDGVEYNSMADNQVKQMVDRLTALVFIRIQRSVKNI